MSLNTHRNFTISASANRNLPNEILPGNCHWRMLEKIQHPSIQLTHSNSYHPYPHRWRNLPTEWGTFPPPPHSCAACRNSRPMFRTKHARWVTNVRSYRRTVSHSWSSGHPTRRGFHTGSRRPGGLAGPGSGTGKLSYATDLAAAPPWGWIIYWSKPLPEHLRYKARISYNM